MCLSSLTSTAVDGQFAQVLVDGAQLCVCKLCDVELPSYHSTGTPMAFHLRCMRSATIESKPVYIQTVKVNVSFHAIFIVLFTCTL